MKQGQLENLARQLAESHSVAGRPRRRPSLLDCLREQETLLRDAYRRFARASEVQLALSYAAEWLLDNFYVVERALRQVREDMPKGYYRQLPKLDTSPLEGYPRIYALTREIIGCCEHRLDLDRVARFVQSYQRVTPLTMGELWALPTMLRLVILENLTRAVASIAGLQAGEGEGLFAAAAPLPEDLEDDVVVANCTLSLRTLETQDLKVFFESVSRVEQILRRDPAGIYARMDFDTRDLYRKVIEELALATGQGEEEVAREAIRLAQDEFAKTGGGGDRARGVSRTTNVGFYLLDKAGHAQLEARLGYRPSWGVRLSRWLLGHPTLVYLGGIALLTLVILVGLVYYALTAGGSLGQLIGTGLLVLLPATAVAVDLMNWIIVHTVPSRPLPRLDFREGIPSRCRTMVVIPAILTDASEARSLLQQLERHFLGNTDPHLHFALLADFADAPQKHMPGDDVLLEQVKAGIQALNKKYGRRSASPFYLFYREREWNEGEECWMGWERKRGKLAMFNRMVLGNGEVSFSVQIGNLDVLAEIKYVVTLDADTVLPRGSVHRLIGTLAHPLNQAEFDPDSGAVVAGYTVLQPRVEIKPTSVGRSLFTRVFTGDSRLDLYTRAVSDVYQDLFGEGSYAGKGIYDVAAFERSLAGRAPDNHLLSHDLFEGIHGRAGLVTDVILYEDYPSHYLAYTHRLHRWVRGDWQLLPWLLPRVPRADGGRMPNDLSVLDRWKILDNLRRSLLTPALLTLLIAGLPGSALVWTLVGLLALAMPVFTGAATVLIQGLRRASLAAAAQSVWIEAIRWLLAFVFLLYEALLVVDAIAAALVRLTITHKRLLQWTTAAHTIRLFGKETKWGLLWKHMGVTSLLALVLALLMGLINPKGLPVAAPLLFAWMVSPWVAYWISRPIVHGQAPLSADQRRQLRRLARRTWLYFEQFVGPDDQWLPPDHFQEAPLGLVAHRTSPTNLGLMLLSTLAAYDLGYIGPLDLALRLRPTFGSMDKLRRYRGHFLNWCDTRSLKPLPPRYVSTVDSGNLAACLLALRQGLRALPPTRVPRWQRWQGLLDTLDVLAGIVEGLALSLPKGLDDGTALRTAATQLQDYLEHMRRQVLAVRDDPDGWALLLARLGDEAWPELERLLISLIESGAHVLEAATLRDLHIWSERVSYQLLSMQSELDMLLPWLLPLSQPPALFIQPETEPAITDAWQALVDALPITPKLDQVPEVCRVGRARLEQLQRLLADETGPTDPAGPEFVEWVQEARDWCGRLAEGLYSGRMAAESLLIGLQDLSAQAEAYFQAMEFDFLFDRQAELFHIGYNLEAGRLDPYYYDLLASEARIASFVAIAKGDVPQSHWLHAGRPLTQIDGRRVLLSWSGTMFEYLMPSLLMRTYEGTLLGQSCRAAVSHQVAYGRQKGVPWGISESAYYRFDAGRHYHYEGFGVPGLGFRRGLADDLVIAPYASLLALSLDPQAVVRNVERLIALRMLGRYGCYEAIDFTPSHVPAGQRRAIVRSYYAHHQGMIMVSLANYLQGGTMVRRFHADLRIQNTDLLLHEQVSSAAPIEFPRPEEVREIREAQPAVSVAPWRVPVDASTPQGHLLSNGRYSVFITSVGSGFSRWQEIDLTRWQADTTLDNWGTWIYVQDRESGALWSASRQPTDSSSSGRPEVWFHAHKAEFRRRGRGISLRMEIVVSPDDDVEIRLINLVNHSGLSRKLALTSYGEVVLAPQANDRSHPAFNKLFIESEYLPEVNGLLFRRRPRSAEEKLVYLAHLLAVGPEINVTGAYESDRGRFLGRGRTPRSPAALSEDGGLSGITGATLDPIMALSQEVDLEPHAQAQVAYITLVAESRQKALALAHRYRDWLNIKRAFDQARSCSELELRRLDLPTSQLECIERLVSILYYPCSALRAAPATLAANAKGQSGLWAYGISGDYPILLVRTHSQQGISLLHELLQAHAYWRKRQVKIDLVILNEHEGGYNQEFHHRLRRLIIRADSEDWMNQRGGIFLLHAEQMSEADRVLLRTVARAVLDEEGGSLADQLGRLLERPTPLPSLTPTLPSPEDVEPTPPLSRPIGLLFDNRLGGFSADGREYVIYLERHSRPAEGPDLWTPAPWINVIANPHFGFLVSEAGAGYTWAENSGENRLTPWRNDPVTDAPGEALYLRDEETAQVWSPTPLPAPASSPYLIRHGAGYSIFEHHSHGLKQRLRLFVVPDAPVKVVQLRLENTWSRNRRITATFYAEWVLGTIRDTHQQYVVPEFDAGSNALLARNPYNEEFGERVAFVAASKEPHGLTADRAEFMGRGGSLRHPAALGRIGLTGTVRAGLDPCAALQVHLDLAPGEAQEVFFLLGQGADRQEALRLVERYQDAAQVRAAWEDMIKFWDGLLGTVTVRTPDAAMDLLLNRWLLYQALSCRVWGRSALYQSSGAFGYRDQLQDVMALVHTAPDIARDHVLRAARHQFEAGDVLHWWHPPSRSGPHPERSLGVRTRCSDDLLWLPFVTAHYVTSTGDETILTEEVPFLEGESLGEEERERYGHYGTGAELYTLYEHCCRALEKGTTAGRHGLPLIGSHDWNDGLNQVGIEGQGESVWLGWFLYATLTRFAPLCERMGDGERAAAYRQRACDLQQALEAHGWDGGWYRRAYYDDSTPLGSAESDECQISSLAQSWAVLSGAADHERAARAMEAVAERLVRSDNQLVPLFAPPFDKTSRDPGYIKGYPPGIRENGGQYTHAALWVAWAFAELGQGDRAEELFRLLNPIYHSDTPERMARYRVEPYVVAADVYSVEPHVGRGGWTWYTGSAGWTYRLGLEAILGLRRVGGTLRIAPCIPRNWPGYELTYRNGETSYSIRVDNPRGVNRGVEQVMLDGEILPGEEIPLLDDGRRHEVRVVMG
ncbi:MAG: GH36-type glycosyl hydrolase domain-containing protein [Anaerolineae bacterium]